MRVSSLTKSGLTTRNKRHHISRRRLELLSTRSGPGVSNRYATLRVDDHSSDSSEGVANKPAGLAGIAAFVYLYIALKITEKAAAYSHFSHLASHRCQCVGYIYLSNSALRREVTRLRSSERSKCHVKN